MSLSKTCCESHLDFRCPVIVQVHNARPKWPFKTCCPGLHTIAWVKEQLHGLVCWACMSSVGCFSTVLEKALLQSTFLGWLLCWWRTTLLTSTNPSFMPGLTKTSTTVTIDPFFPFVFLPSLCPSLLLQPETTKAWS